jgi:uncharacterized RDD family membrane protein YckC
LPDRDAPATALLPGGYYIRRFPWSRLGAKAIDLVTLGPLAGFGALSMHPPSPLLLMAAASLAFPVLEALFISLFGTTFGKAVFRIWVLAPGRRRLNPLAALRRSLMAWLIGLAGGVPLASSVMLLAARRRYLETGQTRWDAGAGAVFTVMRPTFATWLVFWQAAIITLAALTYWIGTNIHPYAG